MSAPMYNVFVGSETGLLKGIDISKNVWDNLNSLSTVDRQKEICGMCWKNKSQNKLCIGLKDKTIQTYDIEQGLFINDTKFDAGEGCLTNILANGEEIITAVDSGIIRFWKNNEVQTEFDAGENLYCMIQNQKVGNQIATGGKENELKVWDLNENEGPVFRAKNVKNDWLNLRVPVWITGIQFLHEENKLVTCTGHHQIRVYDTKTQRRPVLDMQFDEYPLSAIALCHKNTNHVVVGNTRGNMALVDLRVGKMIHLFKGFAGGIKNIQCHKTLPLVASCGLDRFLRIHDLNTKELLHKFYLKSRLNCLLFADNLDINEKDSDEKIEIEQGYDIDEESEEDLWNNMEVVRTKTKRKVETNIGSDLEIKKTKLREKESVKSRKTKKKK